MKKTWCLSLVLGLALAGNTFASEQKPDTPKEDNRCVGSGPQAPRDIDNMAGTNPVFLSDAPAISEMNLCNVHFHRNAEHKAAAYSTYVEDGSNSGWACQEPAVGHIGKDHVEYNGCQGISEGDTIEVHWVYTTCDTKSAGVKPIGAGLEACMTTTCSNPELRVAAQVFVLQKNSELKFSDAPQKHNDPIVTYSGSTTGTSFSNNHCSPFQVTWDVKTTCETLDIDNFSIWCSNNKYNDNHAHGVRELVISEKLLSIISK
ncbi:MAG: cadmium carbonic anhydrase [Proteobacteria bacterium]|nr:cadmium carbonic anhydrase [Pseudomonadota bacterium]MBU1687881.1 cadmium carbonic anhydrase [Pseudomonadota bacterium]